MKIEDELPDGTKRQIAHSGSIPFPPEKMCDLEFVNECKSQVFCILHDADTYLRTLPLMPKHGVDSHAANKLRELASLLELGKYVTSFQNISGEDGKQHLSLTLDPSKS